MSRVKPEWQRAQERQEREQGESYWDTLPDHVKQQQWEQHQQKLRGEYVGPDPSVARVRGADTGRDLSEEYLQLERERHAREVRARRAASEKRLKELRGDESDDEEDITRPDHKGGRRGTAARLSGDDPDLPDAGVLREHGNAAFKKGRLEEAGGLYTRALDLLRKQTYGGVYPPEAHSALCNRSICYRRLGRAEDALDDAVAAHRLVPDQPKPLYQQAAAHKDLGSFHAAVAACDAALERAPGNANLETLRTECAGALAEATEAEVRPAEAELDAASAPLDVIRALDRVAGIYGRLGDYARAAELSERALGAAREERDRPGESSALSQLRRWHQALGDDDLVAKYTDEYLSMGIEASKLKGIDLTKAVRGA